MITGWLYNSNTIIELGAGFCYYSKLLDLKFNNKKKILTYDFCKNVKKIPHSNF